MAPSVSNSKPKQNSKKSLIKPVLPALPSNPKAPKTKPAPVPVPEPPLESVASNVDRLGSSGNIEVTGIPQLVEHHDDDLQQKSEALTVNATEAQTQAPPQELDLEPHADKFGDPPRRGPIAELSNANEISAGTEDSPYQDGLTQSNVSAVSLDDTYQHPMSVQDNSGNESQPWSDDANDTSQPTSLEQAEDTAHDANVNGLVHPNSTDSSKGARSESYANLDEAPYYEESTHDPHKTADMSSGNEQDLQATEAGSQHLSLPHSAQHSRSDSLAIPQLPSIAEHLLQLSTSKLWADWLLMVQASGHQPFATYAHGLLLMRSTRLANLMDRQGASQYSGNAINLHPPRMIVPHAFEAALRFFYSDTVLSNEVLSPKQPALDLRTVRINLLDYLLSYWVSGIELGAEPIVARSAHLLVEFINWDVTEAIMKEATELDSVSWRTSDHRDGVALDYAAMALQLKQTVLGFIASHINPTEFKFDPSANSSLIRSRFAHIEDSRARHNPALATMVFGSMPSSADLSPSSLQSEILPTIASFEEQAASNILVNLRFDDLEFFYRQIEAANGAAATQLITKVIDERENRRQKVVSNRAVPNKQRMTNSETWDVVGSREFFEGGFLRRERVGFLLPTKLR